MRSDSDPSDILTISHKDGWVAFGDLIGNSRSRFWAISREIRKSFAENVVESWQIASQDPSLAKMTDRFHDECASLPGWNESVTRSWHSNNATYVLVSGHAVISDERIESTSILGATYHSGLISAHQIVVTTFAESRDLHLETLGRIHASGNAIKDEFFDLQR